MSCLKSSVSKGTIVILELQASQTKVSALFEKVEDLRKQLTLLRGESMDFKERVIKANEEASLLQEDPKVA